MSAPLARFLPCLFPALLLRLSLSHTLIRSHTPTLSSLHFSIPLLDPSSRRVTRARGVQVHAEAGVHVVRGRYEQAGGLPDLRRRVEENERG